MSAQRNDDVIPSWYPWREQAACRDLDTNLFFPVGEGPEATAQADSAKMVCFSCPVREECLTFALTTRQEAGIFGGLTEEERRRHRRRESRIRRKVS
jgi:WhiB family redox-sensing transcriptional regulator